MERCATSRDVDGAIERLESDPSEEAVLSLTLQTFPHIKRQLRLYTGTAMIFEMRKLKFDYLMAECDMPTQQ